MKNKYVTNVTCDKVYLPSYQDFFNEEYGFDNNNTISKTRECKTTDYARARGTWSSLDSSLSLIFCI